MVQKYCCYLGGAVFSFGFELYYFIKCVIETVGKFFVRDHICT